MEVYWHKNRAKKTKILYKNHEYNHYGTSGKDLLHFKTKIKVFSHKNRAKKTKMLFKNQEYNHMERTY